MSSPREVLLQLWPAETPSSSSTLPGQSSVRASNISLTALSSLRCGHCQKLAPVWDELAKTFEADAKVKIAKLDCTQAQSVCQANEVRGYPTLAYFRSPR